VVSESEQAMCDLLVRIVEWAVARDEFGAATSWDYRDGFNDAQESVLQMILAEIEDPREGHA
jgi:hypothetical protein